MATRRSDKKEIMMDGIVRQLGMFETVEVIVLADLHIGDRNCDVRLVQELVDSVANTPNRFAILAGDIMNNAVIGSPSDTYLETLSPTDQLTYAVTLFKPIADKILAVVPGNHEERTLRTTGFDLTAAMCAELAISDVYSPTSALLFVTLGKNRHSQAVVYSFYINHGRGGGRKPGGKINALQDYANIIDADIFVVGHTHMPATFKDSAFKIAQQRWTARLRERLFVNTASSLKYGGYGQRQGFQPASNSYPIILLSGKEHRMAARI